VVTARMVPSTNYGASLGKTIEAARQLAACHG
jgi:hypothetical protein